MAERDGRSAVVSGVQERLEKGGGERNAFGDSGDGAPTSHGSVDPADVCEEGHFRKFGSKHLVLESLVAWTPGTLGGVKDGVEIEISEGELRLGGLAGVCWIGVGEDRAGVCEYVVKEIILEVLAGERVAVRILEGDDLLLLLLLVRSGGCSGHRWAGGGTRWSSWSIVRHVRIEKRVIDSHRDHHHSGNHAFEYNIRFPQNPSSISFLRPVWFPSLVATAQATVFF